MLVGDFLLDTMEWTNFEVVESLEVVWTKRRSTIAVGTNEDREMLSDEIKIDKGCWVEIRSQKIVGKDVRDQLSESSLFCWGISYLIV